jgi:outer membrane lipoprotein-sorting protein
MRGCFSQVTVSLALFGLVLSCGAASAQAPKTGSTGSSDKWAPKVTTPASEAKVDPAKAAIAAQVSRYFNELKNMKGVFQQTDPDKKNSRGRFYIQKPGKFRFDYAAPNKKIMASDGRLLRIKEPDVSNEEAVELDNTPFRLLLKKDVDLVRDAQIVDAQESEDLLVVVLKDKSTDVPGQVQLYFVKKPEFELKEWVVRDPQGLETKVVISQVNRKDAIDPKIFVWEAKFFQNN